MPSLSAQNCCQYLFLVSVKCQTNHLNHANQQNHAKLDAARSNLSTLLSKRVDEIAEGGSDTTIV